jgi:hypothetical protein
MGFLERDRGVMIGSGDNLAINLGAVSHLDKACPCAALF